MVECACEGGVGPGKFTGTEEEKLILYDRTSDAHAVGVIGKGGELLCCCIRALSREIFVARIVKCGTRQGVCSAARDGIDARTGEIRLANIERRNDDLELFDGFKADRCCSSLTARGSCCAEAEHVVKVCSVNLDIVVPVITTGCAVANSREIRGKLVVVLEAA